MNIFKYRTYETKDKDILNTIKINSYDLIKDIDNLEYFEGLNLNTKLIEDKLLYKYQDEISEEEKNNISDKMIKNNYRVIIEHLKANKDKKSLLKGFLYNEWENELKNNFTWSETLYNTNLNSGNTGSYNKLDLTKIIFLRCVIKMTEYTPISGGNISELNKILELFLNKRSLLILKNNDDKCFLYCYIRKFLNPITKNRFRITRKDKIINVTNLAFDNVSIYEIDKIEKKIRS